MKEKVKKEIEIFFLLAIFVVGVGFVIITSPNITGAVTGVQDEINVEQSVIEKLENNEKVNVIVILKDGSGVKEFAEKKKDVEKKQDKVLDELNLEDKEAFFGLFKDKKDFGLEHKYSTVNAFSGDATKEGIKKLENQVDVEKVVLNEQRGLFLDDTIPLINADDVHSLQLNGVQLDGSGETVCVIDTGVDYTHPNLGNCTSEEFLNGTCSKVVSGYDYANSDSDPMDDHGHGTHISGIVASNNETYRGVASGAKIVAVKVCSAQGSCQDDDVIAGIDWCINNATIFNISVISISLGGSQENSYCDNGAGAAYTSSINNAVQNNISVVIATGNTGGGFTDAGAGIAVPSCIQNATKVTATTKTDAMAGYAFRNLNFTEIIAMPGSSIKSLNDGGGIVAMSGTSMATPHLSAFIAVLQQFSKLQSGRSLNVSDLQTVIIQTGVEIDDSSLSGVNYSRADLLAAVLSLDTTLPVIDFVATTPNNGSEVVLDQVLINISSTKTLESAILEWVVGNLSTNFTMNGSDVNFYFTKANLTDGVYDYRVYATDYANSTGISESRVVEVNLSAAPTVVVNLPLDQGYHNENFNLDVSVNSGTIDASYFEIKNSSGDIVLSESNMSVLANSYNWNNLVNLSESFFSDGVYSLEVFVNNTAGIFVSETVPFTIDLTFPVLVSILELPEKIYHDSNVLFSVNVTDLNLDISLITIETDFSTNLTNYSMVWENASKYNFTLMGDGNLSIGQNVTYRFYVSDLAGNQFISNLSSFLVLSKGVMEASIDTPLDNSTHELGVGITFATTVIDPDNQPLTYYWDFADGTNSTEANVSHLFSEAGSFIVNLTVTDANETVFLEVNLNLSDNSSPVISGLTYDSVVHVEDDGTQAISGLFSDPSGISSVNLSVDGVDKNTSCSESTTSWSCSWLLPILVAGDVGFTFDVVDNSSELHSVTESYSYTVYSCSDNSQNGDEDGVDCGGSCVESCFDDSDSSDSSGSSSSSPGASGGASAGGGGGGASVDAPTSNDDSKIELDSTIDENFYEDEESFEDEPGFLDDNTIAIADTLTAVAVDDAVEGGSFLTGAFSRVIPTSFTKRRAILSSIIALFFLAALGTFILIKKLKAKGIE